MSASAKSNSSSSSKSASGGSSSGSGSESESDSTAWKAPAGYTARLNTTDEKFDWQSVLEDDNLELWAIRCPANFKPKHLEKITGLEAEGSKGKLTARKAEYEVISRKRKKSLGASHAEEGAEEMDQLRVMLPRKEKNGSLWCLDKKPIARNIIIRQTFEPSAEVEADSDPMSEDERPPAKRRQPKAFTYSLLDRPAAVQPSVSASSLPATPKPQGKTPKKSKKKDKA